MGVELISSSVTLVTVWMDGIKRKLSIDDHDNV